MPDVRRVGESHRRSHHPRGSRWSKRRRQLPDALPELQQRQRHSAVSVENVSWVFKHSPYKLGARLVHLALADSANDEHESLIWTSQATIAGKAAVSRAT